MALNAYKKNGDSTHLTNEITLNAYGCDSACLTNGMTLNTYEGKGDSTHLTDETIIHAYEGNGDSACLIDGISLNSYGSERL